jgi:hypothetical protein
VSGVISFREKPGPAEYCALIHSVTKHLIGKTFKKKELVMLIPTWLNKMLIWMERIFDIIKALVSVIVFTLGVGALILAGCSELQEESESNSVGPLNSSAGPAINPVNFNGNVYNAAVTLNGVDPRYDQAWSSAIVQAETARFTNFVYDPNYSYIIQAECVPDSSTDTFFVEVVTLAMKFVSDSMQRVGYISVIKVQDVGWVVQSSVISFVQENPEEYELISEAGVWVKAFPPTGKSYAQSNAAAWSWKSWIKCTLISAGTGCLGGALGCGLAGPGYAACLGSVCAGSMVTGMAACALDQLL